MDVTLSVLVIGQFAVGVGLLLLAQKLTKPNRQFAYLLAACTFALATLTVIL